MMIVNAVAEQGWDDTCHVESVLLNNQSFMRLLLYWLNLSIICYNLSRRKMNFEIWTIIVNFYLTK